MATICVTSTGCWLSGGASVGRRIGDNDAGLVIWLAAGRLTLSEILTQNIMQVRINMLYA
jgi:hypothetical protein